MKERIRELAEQAGYTPLPGFDFANDLQEVFLNKFAELIISDAVNVLMQEWYRTNNSEYNKDPRSVGLHVGMKSGLNKSMVLIRKHFEDKQ